jgi:hypothetical protein
MTPHPANSVPAEALMPELVDEGDGYQKVRIRLRTETGTIVYADLLPAQARVLAGRIGRAGSSAEVNNEGLQAKKSGWPTDPAMAKLVDVVRAGGGVWYPGRLDRAAAAAGVRLEAQAAGSVLWEMAEHGVLRSLGDYQYEIA